MKIVVMLLIVSLCASLSPVAAAADLQTIDLEVMVNSEDDNSDRNWVLKGTVAAGVVAGAFLVGRYIYRGSQARGLYEKAQMYAREGAWDKAVEKYEACLDIRSDFRDARERLKEARREAGQMFVEKGDTAREQELYAEAAEYYQLALKYHPESTIAQARLDKLGQDMVAVHYRRGYQYEVQNRWEEAYAEYKKAYAYNLEYDDLTDRYYRAKARVEGELPLRALVFVIDRTGKMGWERLFTNELQAGLEAEISPDFYMIGRSKVQEVMDEQAEALSEERDIDLAVDLGRILGADEVITGELQEIYSRLGSLRFDLLLEIIDVESGEIVREIEYTHNFGRGFDEDDIPDYFDELVRDLIAEEF